MNGPSGSRTGTGNFIAFNNLQFTLPLLTSQLHTPFIITSNLVSPELNFWFHMHGSQTGKLEVFAQKLDGTRTLLHTITGQQHSTKIAPWTQQSISLTSLPSDTIKIVFVGHKAQGFSALFNISIDDVEIVDAFCSPPVNLLAANPAPRGIELSWQSNTVRSNIEYGPAGYPQGQSTTVYNVSSIYTLSGLQPFTAYDFYVQDSCRVNNSTWTGPYTFTTFCDTVNAKFDASSQGLNVVFNANQSFGNHLNYVWDFGDGTNGSGENPSHIYANPGYYMVELVSTDTCGQSDTAYLGVKVCHQPIAIINYTVNGLIVSFDGTASQGNASYYWNFGSPGIYVNAKPAVVFPAKAIYPIYLVVTDTCGGVDTAFLDLNLCDKPTAVFSHQVVSSGGNGMIVDFDGSYSVGVQSQKWDFGDGNTDTTTLTPTHTYAIPGLHYLVTLIVWGDCGQTDTLSYKLQDVVSINENASQVAKIFPNPAHDKIVVEFIKHAESTKFRWFDAFGRELAFSLIDQSGNIYSFDLSNAVPGSYTLLISLKKQAYTARIVID